MDRTGADFAVMSGGGIRDSIEAGDISYKNVLKVQPFGNVVVYADMTGKEVIDYLTAVAQMKPDSGAYPQFANVSFVAKDGKLNDLKNRRRTGRSGENLPYGDIKLQCHRR